MTYHFLSLAIIIGFEETKDMVNESVRTQEVYVQVFSPPDDQPLPTRVDLVIQTVAGNASENLLRIELVVSCDKTFCSSFQ